MGENETPTPPCTEHVDTDNDGKCDDCGTEMPQQEVNISATLSAEVSTIKAKIELLSDNTWVLSMCYYGDAYTPSADGRWSMDNTTYGITLVVENDTANMLASHSYNLDINYETQKYSATIAITMPDSVPTIGGTALSFDFAQESEAPSQKVISKILNADNGAQKAKIELYEDETWEVSICFYGDNYSPMASGTWELNTTTYNIMLSVVGDEADVLAEDTYTLNVDYQTFEYAIDMTLSVPSVGQLLFSFNSATVVETHYTVTYDLNYSGAPAGGTAETKTFKLDGISKEYVETAPAIPVRAGYKFAGWYTVANPTLTNGASDKEYLFGTKLETAYNQPPEYLTNGVCEISGNTTLYARWVEVKEISTEAQLKEIANDLTGWYKLTADITLTEAWTPIGMYYANYEFYKPDWWLYSFRGTLDGNGHKITGVQLNTLTFAEDAVSVTEGSANGTTALFGSAVNCTVKDLTVEGATITITDYEAKTHAYVSVLAAFVQGTNAKKCGTRFDFNIQTNGTLIDEKLIDFFKATNTTISISYDGSFNYVLRQDTDKVLETINLLKSKDVKFACLSTISSHSVKHLIELFEFFKKEKIQVKFNPLLPDGAARRNTSFLLTKEEWAENYIKLFKYWFFDSTCNIKLSSCCDILAKYLGLLGYGCLSGVCLFRYIAVDAYGNLFPCGRLIDENFLLDNIYNIKDIRQSFLSERFVKILNDNQQRRNKCKNCKWFSRCNSGCNASANLNGDLTMPFEFDCYFTRCVFEAISHLLVDYDLNNINMYAREILLKTKRQ